MSLYEKVIQFQKWSSFFGPPCRISSNPRELPWQPNLDKNKPKKYKLQFRAKNRGIFRMHSRVYRVGNSNYCKKTKQFTTPFKDDIRQLADIKQQISQKMILLVVCGAHRLNVTVLRSNIIFCDICCFRFFRF